MDEYILNLETSKINELVKNIKSEHLCFLMIIKKKEAQEKIYSTMSKRAQNLLKQILNV